MSRYRELLNKFKKMKKELNSEKIFIRNELDDIKARLNGISHSINQAFYAQNDGLGGDSTLSTKEDMVENGGRVGVVFGNQSAEEFKIV